MNGIPGTESMAIVPFTGAVTGPLVSHLRCPFCLRDYPGPTGAGRSPPRHRPRSPTDDAPMTSNAVALLDSSYFRSLPPGVDIDDLVALASAQHRGRVSPVPSDSQTERQDPDPETCAASGADDANLNAAVDRTQGYYAQYFKELRCLGRGSFGGVFLCQHTLDGIELGLFAVKKIPVGHDAAYLRRAITEVQLLERIPRHPNIVEYHHTWFDYAQLADFGPPVRCLFVLLEFATAGSLTSYLEAQRTGLPNAFVWYFFLSALAGTAHLHANGVLHRDLKPENLLLTHVDPHLPPRIFVSDFGTAALATEGRLSAARTGGTGTEEYMAPELFETDEHSQTYIKHHTAASDVWSLGLILHYLACDGDLPAVLPDSGGERVLNVDAHSSVSRPPEMVALMRAMLQHDPSRRPSCAEILRSEYVVALRSTLLNELKWGASPSAAARGVPREVPLIRDRVSSVPRSRQLLFSAETGTQTDPVKFAE